MRRLSNDINRFYDTTRPFPSHISEKERLIRYIGECVTYLYNLCILDLEDLENLNKIKSAEKIKSNKAKIKFLKHMNRSQTSKRPWTLFKFGSESWGTSCSDSDVDIAIYLNFRNRKRDKIYILKTLSQIIGENDNDIQLHIQTLLNAKYPIIRIYHLEYDYIKIDISIADRFCLKRNVFISDLINYYEDKLNLQIRKLVIFIKYWSKNRGINDSYKCYLNSFGFTLLIIKFIQYFVNKNDHIIYYNKCIATLLFEFFVFYVVIYDISKYRVSILNPFNNQQYNKRNNHIFKKKKSCLSIMEIIDPVNKNNNIAQNVGFYQYNHMKTEFIRSFQILRDFMMGKKSEIPLFDILSEIPDNYSIDDVSDINEIKSNIPDVHSSNDDESQATSSNESCQCSVSPSPITEIIRSGDDDYDGCDDNSVDNIDQDDNGDTNGDNEYDDNGDNGDNGDDEDDGDNDDDDDNGDNMDADDYSDNEHDDNLNDDDYNEEYDNNDDDKSVTLLDGSDIAGNNLCESCNCIGKYKYIVFMLPAYSALSTLWNIVIGVLFLSVILICFCSNGIRYFEHFHQ